MYSFVVFIHVLSVIIFLLAHGVSITVFFLIRRQPSVERTRILMEVRKAAVPVMMIAFLVLILSGIGAASIGQWWSRGWVWASIGVLVGIFLAMGFMGRTYFDRIQNLFQPAKRTENTVAAVLHTQDLVPVLRNSHPRILSLIGVSGLVVILYLMMYKPF